MKKEKYIKVLRRVETFYEIGTIILFILAIILISSGLFYGSLAAFLFMFIFGYQKVRLMNKANKKEVEGCGKVGNPWGESSEVFKFKCGSIVNKELYLCEECVKDLNNGEKGK